MSHPDPIVDHAADFWRNRAWQLIAKITGLKDPTEIIRDELRNTFTSGVKWHEEKLKQEKRMQTRKYGWIPSLPALRDEHNYYAAAKKTLLAPLLPPIVDLRPQCSPIQDQGQLGSCTANAIAGAFDFERGRQSLPFMQPSRLFIYYNERAIEGTINSDAGAQIRDGFKVINTHGVCYESQWPYDIAAFAQRPWPNCYQKAKQDKCLSYLAVAQYTSTMKECLSEGYPFVFGFTVYESFESDAVAASGIVPMPGPNEAVVGGHAVVAVGYNDATQRFYCRNSWGTDWGQAGYFEMPYAYLNNPNLSDDFWTIRLVEK